MANPDEFLRLGSTLFRIEEEGAWIQLDLAHERIHLGQVWSACRLNSTVANSGTATVTMVCGAIQPHVLFNISVGGNCNALLTEGGSVSGGAAITAYNRNRGVAGTPTASVSYAGTVDGNGTIIWRGYIPGGSGPQKTGGGARQDSEFVLAENKTYTMSIVNVSGGNAAVSVDLDWYEVSEV